MFDGRWAHHNRQAEIDWGYRAVHETARVTKELIEAYYGRRPERSYFGGCSGGGRQANMEAWRYPDDLDGIVSGCTAADIMATAMQWVWLARANTGPDGRNLITTSEIRLLEEAVHAACDALDGLEDGLIDDPYRCRFDLATLSCEGNDANCLSKHQVEALRKMYDGPRDSAGRRLLPGLPFGSEPYWEPWIIGATADVGDDRIRRGGLEFMRYMAFLEDPGEKYALEDFDFDRDPQRLAPMARIYNADNSDLDAFRERGGKLLMWSAGADPFVPTMRAITYYEAVEERVGERDSTQSFFRLFVVPGMDHCGFAEGPGIRADGFDPLTALEKWVEQGEAPASLLTTKTDAMGKVVWTRPVCPYPQRAVYDGDGDIKDASNFECVTQTPIPEPDVSPRE